MRTIEAPLSAEVARQLRAGDLVSITGTILGARDAAHKRLVDLMDAGHELPVELAGQIIYYVGPSPARPGRTVGAAGPTTAGRMDSYTPRLLAKGVKATIGKGKRSPEVVASMQQYGAVYLGAVGGAGALLSQKITQIEVLAWEELGPEALFRMTFSEFPALVVTDSTGESIWVS